jgi:hypothetical protein
LRFAMTGHQAATSGHDFQRHTGLPFSGELVLGRQGARSAGLRTFSPVVMSGFSPPPAVETQNKYRPVRNLARPPWRYE